MSKPPTGQTPFQRGERLTAAKLNEWVTKRPTVEVFGEGHSEGGVVAVDGRESMYVRLTGKTGSSPIKYAWKRVSREANGTWSNLTHTGNVTNDYAVEVNNADLTVNTTTIYKAERSLTTGEWLLENAGGGGGNTTVNITSGETVLMILGTYDEYANCPGVPPRPPTTYANLPCSENRTDTLCVPAYAYAVYNRCGYVWNKVGDTRDFQVWANELNGGSTTAWRRFVIPRWGGDIDPATGLPDPDAECMGVAFIGSSAGALTCSCPTWASSGQCLLVKYRIIDRPFPTGNGGYSDCNDTFIFLDDGDSEGPYWGRDFTALINLTGSLCSDGSDGSGPITFAIAYEDTARNRCDWGPDVFDPCNPCDGFGRFYVTAELNSDIPQPNCGGAGHFSGYLSIADIRDIICNCATKSLRELVKCDACDGGETLPPLHFVDFDTVEFTCCPDEIDGGSAGEPSPDGVIGAGSGLSFEGGEA